ncbi:metallophosphoesterase family protein [Desulfonatronum thioautotrophicum]|uniref:metallophosphoesterase family protein n=1 Tax=Desulfonatronum thioautotrophicum TaxID=617001 RepID=UPI0005EB5A5B|nr:metallophosphoesterase [Desulfonatronum thioautotrophicum]
MSTFPFWIGFGDIHEQTGNVRQIPELAEAEAVLVSGDLTNRGRKNAAERILQDIQRINPRIFAQIGNMDYPEVEDFLNLQGMNIHARGLDLGNGVGLMGVGYSTPTPFGTPGEVSDDQLAVWLAQAHEPVKDLPHLLLVAHNPPFGTATDKVGGRTPVGSQAVRAFIEKIQPEVCLTGHIHEARAEDHIGKTQVINPGPLAGGGYALIRLTESGLRGELRMIVQNTA